MESVGGPESCAHGTVETFQAAGGAQMVWGIGVCQGIEGQRGPEIAAQAGDGIGLGEAEVAHDL